MKRKIQLGIVGLGAFMGRQHLPNLAANPRCALHTLCDLDAALLQARAETYRPARPTTAADDVFRDPEIDAVLVGTRNHLHAAFIEQALACGKHVFVEKPMTSTVDETERVLGAAARRPELNIGVGFNRRFAPAMTAAKRVFRERMRGPVNLVYRIVDDHEIRPRYIFDMNDGGGHLLLEACHIFDLIAWLLEEEPVEVYAAGPLETDNAVIIKLSGGSLAMVLCGGKGGLYYPKECLEVFGSRTTLAVDQFFELRVEGPGGARVERFALDPKSSTPSPLDTMTDFYRASFRQRPAGDVPLEAQRDAVKLVVDKGHAGVIDAFLAAIQAGTAFAPGAIDGARATVMALGCYESIRRNRPVAIARAQYGMAP